MKIAISGKGGVGKTTLAASLARLLASEGKPVIAIDADPSTNLSSALGVPSSIKISPVSEMEDLIRERTGASSEAYGKFFRLNPTVSDLPDKLFIEHAGVKLMVIGGIYKGGGGCACPANVFLKMLLMHLIIQRGEAAIVDMEAGIEHLGRATVQAVDALIVVVEPGKRSIDTARQIQRMAKEIGIKKITAVGNKVRGLEQENFLRKELAGVDEELELLGFIPYDDDIALADLEGRSPWDGNERLKEATKSIRDKLIS